MSSSPCMHSSVFIYTVHKVQYVAFLGKAKPAATSTSRVPDDEDDDDGENIGKILLAHVFAT